MNKFLSILAAIEGIEEAVLASKVPVVSTGIGGTVLSVALIAETEVSTFLQAFQSSKIAATPTTTATVSTTAAPVAQAA